MNMKNPLIGVAFMAASLLLTACGNSEANRLRGEFIKGCMSAGQDKSVCSCAYETLEEKYPPGQLKRFSLYPSQAPAQFLHDTLNGMRVCTGHSPLPDPKPEPVPAAPAQAPAHTPKTQGEVGGPIDGSRDYTEFGNGEVQLAPGAANPSSTTAEEPPPSI